MLQFIIHTILFIITFILSLGMRIQNNITPVMP